MTISLGVAATLLMAGDLCAATLAGFARLPAATLAPGPDSGHFISAPQGMTTPFGGQVAQGFSALLSNGRGGYIALADNGFGTRENSPDSLLRLYLLNANFRTAGGGLGNIDIEGFINLSDPDHHMPYRIVAEDSCYRDGAECVQVDRRIRSHRLLTGADLDPESLQPGDDGTFWVGDEFGPFLLHFGSDGTLLEPPFALSGLVAENRPGRGSTVASVRRSKGFEAMARAPFGHTLLPMLEGPMVGESGVAKLYSFDTGSERFTNTDGNAPSYRYPLDELGGSVGAFKLYSENAGLVLERDSGAGKEARFKKIFRIDLRNTDERGLLIKEEFVDLLDIEDPHDLDRDGSTSFALPMSTIEGFIIRNRSQLVIVTDNNFPFGDARGVVPEDTELILIDVDTLW